MTAQPIVPGDLLARTRTVNGLRELADFLQANPAVPVHDYGWTFSIYGRRGVPDAYQRAEVDHIAELLGVQVRDETARGGHYYASRSFGLITYEAVHISAQRVAAYEAETSYRDNIRLHDEAVA
jgi:hypothetical protein